MFSTGDIVQIIDETHPWFPALLIVDEVKSWGVRAYLHIPESNVESACCSKEYNRLDNEQIKRVGTVAILEK